jgi:hypothetical protein
LLNIGILSFANAKRQRNAYELFIFTGICGATDNARILRKKSSLTFALDRACA